MSVKSRSILMSPPLAAGTLLLVLLIPLLLLTPLDVAWSSVVVAVVVGGTSSNIGHDHFDGLLRIDSMRSGSLSPDGCHRQPRREGEP